MWDLTEDGEPLDLSSVDVTVVIKPSEHYEDDDDLAHVLTEGDGVTIVSAAAGRVRVRIPDAVTAAPSQWFYKITPEVAGSEEPAIIGTLWVADA
jgi:hypothetical protein